MEKNNIGNILLHQFVYEHPGIILKELIPCFDSSDLNKELILTKSGNNVYWASLDLSLNVLVNNIFDKQYVSNGYMYDVYPYYYPQAGINFLAGLTLKF